VSLLKLQVLVTRRSEELCPAVDIQETGWSRGVNGHCLNMTKSRLQYSQLSITIGDRPDGLGAEIKVSYVQDGKFTLGEYAKHASKQV
jgi:hypothetical protein